MKSIVFGLLISLFAVPSLASTQARNIGDLANAIQRANDGVGDKYIEMAPGTYNLNENWGYGITADGITIIGTGLTPADVVLTGPGIQGGIHHAFQVYGDMFRLENLTIQNVNDHAVQVHGESGADEPTIRSCVFRNIGDQYVKISYVEATPQQYSSNGLIENCVFEQTVQAPDYYTGGIDGHACENYVVRECTFTGIVSPTSTVAEPVIHFWSGSRNNIIERNKIVGCDRGIGFGLGNRGHVGGTIRNNMVSNTNDVGIGLESCEGVEVYNNTVYSPNNYPFAIEIRFASNAPNQVRNNLANKAIGIRDNGFAILDGNVDRATAGDFVSDTDLHLRAAKASADCLVLEDFDGDQRQAPCDVGADEFRQYVPPQPTRKIAENDALTALAIGAIHFPNHLQAYINWIKTEIPGLLPTFPDTTQTPPDTGSTPPDTSSTPPDTLVVGEGLVVPGDLEYLGAFKLSGNSYAYGGGRALGFYPPNGTLYINGSDLTGRFAEIQIPSTLSTSRNVSNLPSATVLRSSSDATGGLWNVGGQIPRIGGGKPFYMNGAWHIFFGTYDNYDVNWKDLSGVGYFDPDFTNPKGRWHPGPKVGADAQSIWYGGKTSHYGTMVPQAWADAHVGGKNFAVGRTRGEYNLAESCGPALYAVDFSQPNSNGTLNATCLLCYPTTGAQGENTVPPRALPGYSLTTEWTDVVWVDDSVIFFGNSCRYPSHYYDADPNMNNDPGVCGENKGYTCGSQGNTPPGYVAEVLFYDSADLAKVASGNLNPWDPRPYVRGSISDYLLDAGCRSSVAGVAYDSVGRKLYVVELGKASPDNPVIHVFLVH